MRRFCFPMFLALALPAAAVRAQTPPVIVYPAGAYTITTPGPTSITWTATSVTFLWGAVTPVPVPPIPPPVPVPVLTGHVWALAIFDPAVTLPASQQAALTSLTLQASSLLLDVDFQAHKKTDTVVSSWLPHVPDSGLPALLFVQKDPTGKGVLAYTTAFPWSEAASLSLIKQVRGK